MTKESTATPNNNTPERSRTAYTGLLLGIILLGLTSRHFGHHLPYVIAKYPGDVLWDTAFYALLVLITTQISPAKALAISIAAGVLIEAFKLYDPPSMHAFRETTVGALLLGHAFSWANIICYVLGGLIAYGIDLLIISRAATKR